MVYRKSTKKIHTLTTTNHFIVLYPHSQKKNPNIPHVHLSKLAFSLRLY